MSLITIDEIIRFVIHLCERNNVSLIFAEMYDTWFIQCKGKPYIVQSVKSNTVLQFVYIFFNK